MSKTVEVKTVDKDMALAMFLALVDDIKKQGHEVKVGTMRGSLAIALPWAVCSKDEAGELVVKVNE